MELSRAAHTSVGGIFAARAEIDIIVGGGQLVDIVVARWALRGIGKAIARAIEVERDKARPVMSHPKSAIGGDSGIVGHDIDPASSVEELSGTRSRSVEESDAVPFGDNPTVGSGAERADIATVGQYKSIVALDEKTEAIGQRGLSERGQTGVERSEADNSTVPKDR